jgi:hypothetical protein
MAPRHPPSTFVRGESPAMKRATIGSAILAALDASIARGLADAEAGRTSPAEELFDRLDGKYRAAAGRAESRSPDGRSRAGRLPR